MLIVHVGLGKTATTFLQQNLFPHLCKKYSYVYNPEIFLKIKKQKYFYSLEDKNALSKVISSNNILISNEGLASWNPRKWEQASNRIYDLFGGKAKIVITIRDPLDYLTSVYIQRVQEGNVVKAEDYFVSSDVYDRLQPFLSENSLLRFDVNSLDFQLLVELYKKRFEEVYVLPLSSLNTMYPWSQLFKMNTEDIEEAQYLLQKSKKVNISFSKLALKLTFYRETILNCFGAKSLGSEDLLDNVTILSGAKDVNSYKTLNLSNKIAHFPERVFNKIFRPWRWWMQEVVDKIVPYQKYTLPNSVYLDENLMIRNREFINKINDEIENTIK